MQSRRQLRFVSRESLQKAREELGKLAETRNPNATIPQKVTRPRAIRALRREIAATFKKGYEVEDVLAALSQQGIEIDPVSFREYWRQANKKRTSSGDAE